MRWISSPESWMALVTLTILEIVLGIDNIVFISILAEQTASHTASSSTQSRPDPGDGHSHPVVIVPDLDHAPHKTVICGLGARGLRARSYSPSWWCFSDLEKCSRNPSTPRGRICIARKARDVASMGQVLVQIALLDIVFSLDSVITAVGMANQVVIMILAIMLAVAFMIFAAGHVSAFVDRHPTVKMLALSFLLLIGVTLIADGIGQHISKGYVYFAMAFAVFVEMLNLRGRRLRPAN